MNSLKVKEQKGTTLIEVLVVIVVFLVGILAVAQVFPGGFRILNESRDRSVANSYSIALSTAIAGDSSLLPDAVVPVPMNPVNGGLIPLNRSPFDNSLYGLAGFQSGVNVINPDGTVSYNGTNVGNYRYFEGPNVFDGIAGINVTIPANPNQVAMLPYGPTFQTAAINTNIAVFSGNYAVIQAQPSIGVNQAGEVFLTNAANSNAFLQIPIVPNAGATPNFALSVAIYVNNAGVTQRVRLNQVIIPTGGIGTVNGNYLDVQLSALAPGGTNFLSVDPESIEVQRQFDQVPNGTAFTVGDPYQYHVLNPFLGTLQFNPAACTFRVFASNGDQLPLKAVAFYTILDWGIISDSAQIQADQQTYRLSFPSVMVTGDQLPDRLSYSGLEIPSLTGAGVPVNSDVVFLDAVTGGMLMYTPNAQTDPTQSDFTVDKSGGWFQITPNPAGPITTLTEYPIDTTTPTGFSTVPVQVPLAGLQVRVLYRAKNNWMRMIFPSAATYNQTTQIQNPTDYGVGPILFPGGNPAMNTRIYFPAMMAGQKVTVDQIYYQNGSGNVQQIQGQSFLIHNTPADPNTADGYVDIRDYDPNATLFDFSHGYAVRGVHGMTYSVEVLHNSTFWSFGPTPAQTVQSLMNYEQGWSVNNTQSIVSRGVSR